MLVPSTVKCDVCEAVHGSANGWYSVGPYDITVSIEILKYSDDYAETHAAICGDNCLHTYISQNVGRLHERKLPA